MIFLPKIGVFLLKQGCVLSIFVATTDVSFMMQTIPHLVRMCNFDFTERILIMDTAPLSGDFRKRAGTGSVEELKESCRKLIARKIMDSVVEVDYSPLNRRRIYKKHFKGYSRQVKDYRGYPVFGSLFAIEAAMTKYLLHLDADILLYQKPGHSWIKEGIELLKKYPDIIFVGPLPGPPRPDQKLIQQKSPYLHDPRGFYRFKIFTSRRYLMDVEKYNQLLPLRLKWRSPKRNGLERWEAMVTSALLNSRYVRADLDSPNVWSLHNLDHGERFCRYLPEIIRLIELGKYPEGQAGRYDLNLEDYIRMVKK